MACGMTAECIFDELLVFISVIISCRTPVYIQVRLIFFRINWNISYCENLLGIVGQLLVLQPKGVNCSVKMSVALNVLRQPSCVLLAQVYKMFCDDKGHIQKCGLHYFFTLMLCSLFTRATHSR